MGLPPDAFWALSIPEWQAAVSGWRAWHGLDARAPMQRGDLADLMKEYPDVR